MGHHDAGDEADGEECHAEPQQAFERDEEFPNGGEVAEEAAAELVVFEAFIKDEKHDSGDGGEGECAVGEDGHGAVGFTPEGGFGSWDGLWIELAGKEGEDLEENDEGGGENAEQGDAVDWANEDVEEGEGPGKEGGNFRDAVDGAGGAHFSADAEVAELADKGGGHPADCPAAFVTVAEDEEAAQPCQRGKDGSEDEKPAVHGIFLRPRMGEMQVQRVSGGSFCGRCRK